MLDKLPILIVLLIIVFLATSLFTFIAIDDAVEDSGEDNVIIQSTSSAGAEGMIILSIKQPETPAGE